MTPWLASAGRVLTLMIAWLLLSSCAGKAINELPDELAEISVQQREAQLNALSAFEFRGGLGIWTDEQSISARVHWVQAPDTLTLHLSGPLGIGDFRLDKDSLSARLTRGQTPIATGESADAVLQRGLGLSAPVPLEELQQWVRGLPGNASSLIRDDEGKLSSVRYRDASGTGWQARFLRYSRVDNVMLPSLITASGGPYSVRLLLKNWQTDTPSIVPELQQSNNRLPIPSR